MTIEEIIGSLEDLAQEKDRLSGGDSDSDFTHDADVLMEAARLLRHKKAPVKLDRIRWEGCPICISRACETCKYTYYDKSAFPCCDCFRTNRFVPDGFCPACGRPITEKAWAELERRMNGGQENS